MKSLHHSFLSHQQKRGHKCTFTIEFESVSCLIQQQQQQQQLPSSRKSLLSGFKIQEHLDRIGSLINDTASPNGAPPHGVLHKRVVLTWKRGNKKYVCIYIDDTNND
jgi:hypothetical protein